MQILTDKVQIIGTSNSGTLCFKYVTTTSITLTGAPEPVQNWVRKITFRPKSGWAKPAFCLLEAQKVGVQMNTLAH